MHKNLVKSRLKRTLLAASISALSFSATAAGLGRITVLSGLGQPLRAEVEIAASPEEIQNMTARLASVEAFRQAGVDYPSSVSGLRMAVERRGNGAVVRVTSDRPINEPFVDMLVELNWSAGRLIREYTFLLDPPDAGAPRAAVAVASPEMRGATPYARAEAAASRRATTPRAARPVAAPGAGRTYTVQPGDTLNRIAMENRPEGVSMEQMLTALFQGNRAAFAGDNMNRLQAGRILRIPDAESIRQGGEGGRQQIVAQSADFGRYRQKLAEQAAAAPAKETPAVQRSAGKIGAKVEDRAPAAAGTSDQLKVSKSEEGLRAGAAGGEKSVARLQALEEDLVSRDKALREANTRLAELEKSIKELQRLVELKSQGMAQMQSDAPPAQAAAPVAPPVAQAPVPPAAPVPAAVPEAEKPAALPKAPEPIVEPKPAPPAPVAEAPKPAPASPPPEAPSNAPSDDSSLYLGIGGVLALLLGWGGYKLYQRRSGQGAPTTTPALSEFGDGSNSVFGSAGGQSVDTGSSSQIQTDFSQSGLSSIDTDEGVDPVAEADVYMAYGRDAQAEEILLDALKTDPGRTGVHLKLLEIYAQRKNLKQFETTATELYSLTGGNGQDWEKAAALGRKVDPDSPLYRIPAPGVPAGPAAMPSPPSVPAGPQTISGAVGGATGFVQAGAARVPAAQPAFVANEPQPPVSDDPLESPSQLKDTWALPGDLNQYTSMEDIDRAVSADTQQVADVAHPEPVSLDFDLDLNAGNDANSARTVTLNSSAPSASSGLDFDLGFDQSFDMGSTLVAGDAMPPSLQSTSTKPQRLSTDLGLPDPSDLDFELSSEFGTHSPDAGDQTVDVDLTATLADDGIRESLDSATVDLERTSFDSSLLDFDFELDDKAEPKAPTRTAVADLSPTRLSSEIDTAIELPDAGPPTEPPLDLDLQQEVATKLELARAYEEMGDKDGARELVEEVLREGSGRQQEEARTILSRLS
ncbi:FimV/HubP family polar landmark protein [Zoogloea sp.]|uniref:FimV/HubP family polar landmark protein n=1 Tax=Zoogloea sp. TaxID=49181 RepID=UPI0035B09159